jgi:glutamine phosphoribosylpyrophosphate amidotransferase
MDCIIYSKHFQKRLQQRSLNNDVVRAILSYGVPRKVRGGAESLTLTKESLVDIRNDYGPAILRMCEKLKNTYIIMSGEGAMITIARSYRVVH